MNPNIKTRYLVALRGGEYLQCRGLLRRANGYCILGVLCDIYAKEKNVPWELTGFGTYSILGKDAYLPYEIKEWAGVPSKSVITNKGKSLVTLNDRGYLFDDLSKIIEDEL